MVTMGHLRVNIGQLRVIVGHPRVSIGHLRATMGHLVDYRYRLSISIVDYSLSKLKENLTELHLKVRPTCLFYRCCLYYIFVC